MFISNLVHTHTHTHFVVDGKATPDEIDMIWVSKHMCTVVISSGVLDYAAISWVEGLEDQQTQILSAGLSSDSYTSCLVGGLPGLNEAW